MSYFEAKMHQYTATTFGLNSRTVCRRIRVSEGELSSGENARSSENSLLYKTKPVVNYRRKG